ncbi:ChuX/HutX family heme-like substrate-binding protein [Azospirillum sp. HJ39]|uniref:ChuX/HutX family heme-like substrate-binding protein n=1 Tax=Azospirillum sp. HJ39 TaxID=3159496 RepID=UPI003556E751
MPDTPLPSTEQPPATGHVRLDVDWPAVLPRLDALGPVRVVTGNTALIHEKVGAYGNVSGSGHALIVLNRDVDLRIFPRHWSHTVHDPAADAILVRDGHGRPIHAIHRTAGSDPIAWESFLADHRTGEAGVSVASAATATAAPAVAEDADIDVAALRAAWAAMTDVHEFHGMLKRFGVERLRAMRLAGRDFAREIPLSALAGLLETARDHRQEIMVFVGNPGCIQIHTGRIDALSMADDRLTIDDPGFRLRCDMARLASAWVVFKPTGKGGITTVELYDRAGETCAILCGQRDEDKPERAEWRALARSLPDMPEGA